MQQLVFELRRFACFLMMSYQLANKKNLTLSRVTNSKHLHIDNEVNFSLPTKFDGIQIYRQTKKVFYRQKKLFQISVGYLRLIWQIQDNIKKIASVAVTRRCSPKKPVLKNLPKLTREHLFCCLPLNKDPQPYQKVIYIDSHQVS